MYMKYKYIYLKHIPMTYETSLFDSFTKLQAPWGQEHACFASPSNPHVQHSTEYALNKIFTEWIKKSDSK